MPIVRYDTAHGYAHKDLMNPDGSKEKIFLGEADFNEALTLADVPSAPKIAQKCRSSIVQK